MAGTDAAPHPAPRVAQVSAVIGWIEGTDAYARLRAASRRPLLLDGAGAHPEARHAFVAFDPVEEFRADTATPASILSLRRRVAATTGPAVWSEHVEDKEPAAFTGGWAGYFGYESVAAFEPTLPRHPPARGIPDILFRLYLGALVIDAPSRLVTVYCTHPGGDEGKAQARLEEVLGVLAKGPRLVAESLVARPTPWQGSWHESLPRQGFEAMVERLKARIAHGDLFQANLATRFQAPCAADPLDLFVRLRMANPSPFMGVFEYDSFSIVSGSPEQLFALENGTIRSRPIAGTRKRGTDDDEDLAMERELLSDPKEKAEHTMLVDLVRNDVAKVALPGSVRVPERMSVERYRHVMHLVSRVEGKIRPGLSALDVFASLFPGGTVTGAPKHRACLRIHEAEPVARGPYTGSAGFISWSGNAHFNILIRTIVLTNGLAAVHAGSGIVADSDPAREWKEAGRKGQALLEAAQGGATTPSTAPGRLGEVTRQGKWEPPHPVARSRAKVLLIDNYDSFVHNIADYCAALGAQVEVVRNDSDWRGALAAFSPTHIILSPGPGWPDEAGCTLDVVREVSGKIPVLGVCLGHQAIAQALGGRVEVGAAIHGKVGQVVHNGRGLFAGLPSPLAVARYHSLHTPEAALPPEIEVTARLADGTVMAFRHRRHPTFGLQFHPESICTEGGLELLSRFLEQHA